MQALYTLAHPGSGYQADRHSYGFRAYRSTADAIAQCFICPGAAVIGTLDPGGGYPRLF